MCGVEILEKLEAPQFEHFRCCALKQMDICSRLNIYFWNTLRTSGNKVDNLVTITHTHKIDKAVFHFKKEGYLQILLLAILLEISHKQEPDLRNPRLNSHNV